MKTTIIAVTCAICSAACAGSSQPPAQDPTSASAAATMAPTGSPGASATFETNTTTSNPAPTTTNGSTPTSSTGATSMMGTGANPPVTTPAPVTPAPGATAPGVTTNPGAADHTGSADNTRVNTRDRSGTLTPVDQGNSKAEIAITASIRRSVMGDHSLSFTAKNVKIITVGSRVTLRGPVKSDAERTQIENLARQATGVTDVDNQLEVKN